MANWFENFRETLEADVFGRPSSDVLFNMYRDAEPGLDVPDAAARRRSNLLAYLESYPSPPRVLIAGEAPGPWGCRYSGVPITDESQLLDATFPLHGSRTSLGEAPLREYSAGIFWRAMQPAFPRFLFWNTVPWHPHKRGTPLSIRTPRTTEVREGTEILARLCAVLEPVEVLALGRKAEGALSAIGLEATYIRHPSQGGARLFTESMKARVADWLADDQQ